MLIKELKRLTPHGLVFRFEGEDKGLTTQFFHEGKTITVEANIGQISKSWVEWEMGKLIQNAFPYLSMCEREFLISGLTGDEFDALFKDAE